MADPLKPGPALPKLAEPKAVAKPKPKKGRAPKTPKPPKGLIIKEVDLSLFRMTAYLVVRNAQEPPQSFTPEDNDTFYTLLGGNSREEVELSLTHDAGFVQRYGNRIILAMLVYQSKSETFPRVALSVLVHECDHVATAIVNHLGMTTAENSGDETHAYITGYLARNLYKLLIANNVFIDNGN